MNLSLKTSVVIVLLFLTGFLLYSNTFHHSFHFDDYVFIVNNPEITDITDIRQIWNEGSAPTRFVTYLTFAINYHFHRFEEWGYHLGNIAIHSINSGLVFWLTLLIFRTPTVQRQHLRDRSWSVAILTAALFLVHPMQTQAVTYICQRFASLATLFYLLTVCWYLKARLETTGAKLYVTLAVISAVCGMFTKQIVLTLPMMIVFLEICLFERFSLKQIWSGRNVKWLILLLAFLLLIPAVYRFDTASIIGREFDSLSHRGDVLNSPRYLLTQFRVIWTYIRLMVLPVGQNLLYDFPASYTLWEGRTLMGLIGLGLLIGFAYWCRRRFVFVTLGIGWFLIALLVESSIIPIRQVIFEHRCYLPSYGWMLMTAAVLVRFLSTPQRLWSVSAMVLITLAILTYQRNQVWRDGITLWTDVLAKSPNMIRPYTHLATAYLNAGRLDEAIDIYTRGIEVDPQRAESYNNRGNVYVIRRQYDMALKDYKKALSLDDSLVKTYNNVGIIYNRQKNFPEALKYYNKALELDDQNSGAYFNRANIYLQLNQLEAAFKDYSRSLELDPFKKRALYYRSQIYAVNQDYRRALEDILKAQELGLKVDAAYINDLRKQIQLQKGQGF